MKISNRYLSAEISLHGAELVSLKRLDSGEELIWTACPDYWARHAPMLFPIVGKVWNGRFLADGREYPMSQHGFARDMDFTVTGQSRCSVTLVLESDAATLKAYPYPFRLEATYSLRGTVLSVQWKVINTGKDRMYYQIGAHPGFNLRDFHKDDFIHGYFRLVSGSQPVQDVIIGLLTPDGYRSDRAGMLNLDSDAMLPLTPGLFAGDALVLEEHQIDQVVLYDKTCTPYIAVKTVDAPVWGLWSPPAKNAPFVCIEPWMGRCDYAGYDGDISGRDYMNSLESGADSTFKYRIAVL